MIGIEWVIDWFQFNGLWLNRYWLIESLLYSFWSIRSLLNTIWLNLIVVEYLLVHWIVIELLLIAITVVERFSFDVFARKLVLMVLNDSSWTFFRKVLWLNSLRSNSCQNKTIYKREIIFKRCIAEMICWFLCVLP